MSKQAGHIGALTSEQRKLMLQRLQSKQGRASQGQILPQGRETNVFPLSFAQQRFWFLDQMEPGNIAYLIMRVQRFLDKLSLVALDRALEALVQRHEMLRTTFEERAGQPVQVIHAMGRHTFPVIDLQGLRREHHAKEAQQLLSQERRCPCDLASGPLFRMVLVRLGKREHIMALKLHHIITDAWSNEILMRELITLYRAFASGHSSPLAPLPIQYADYAVWQRRWLQGEVLESQLAYWRKQLAGESPLRLPTDHARPAVQSYRGATQTCLVPGAILAQLRTLSHQEGVTLFMLLLAAFQVLLQRYTGQHDISVGTPIANRTRAGTEGVIGLFVNTLVIRCDLSGNPIFQDVLRSVRETCLQAYAHQDIPFEKVVEALQPERDVSRSPLFQVMFMLQEGGSEQKEPAEALAAESSKFEMTLMLKQTTQGLWSTVEYCTDLFAAETIARLLKHWQICLQGLVQTPQARLAELPLLTVHEREQMLVAWNATRSVYPDHLCLHDLFNLQAALTPDAIAVESGQEQWTYQQLDQLANQMAHYLRHLGVGPEVLVGIGLERSMGLITAVLGILKAGGAYIPLDTTYPKQRLTSIVEEARLTILVTDSHLRASLPEVEQVLCLDTDWPLIAQYSGEKAPVSTTLPTNLAYVLYTSGSTGQPKGVMISHRAVVHYVDWSSKQYAVAAGSGAPVHSPLSFDLTITSLFPALTVGRKLVLVPDAPGVEALHQILSQKHMFSVLKITPAHLTMLGQSLQPEEFSAAARALIIGGEALHGESVSPWRKYAPEARVINEYGPTETAVGCCIYEIPPGEQLVGVIPIGRPIPDTQIYLLDAQLCAVPFGVPGDLYIGGAGLGRGYLQRPDLTAERFIANPFSKEPGARLYKTGDLARYISADGTLEYLGRIDTQVKLRGYRIELAEVEAAIRQHPQVADCAVLLEEEGPAAPRLISYVVACPGSSPTAETLKKTVEDALPAYMVPSLFLRLDALPLTPNGKVDRRRLPRAQQSGSDKWVVRDEGRGPLEDVLLMLWRELLAAPTLGVHENFFAAGGHSLLATRLVAQIRAVLQVELPVRAVFEMPTVAELAQRVKHALDGQGEQVAPPLVAVERPKWIPLSFAQQRLWFLDRLQPGNIAYLIARAQPFLGPLHMRSLERSLQDLVGRHESLRTTFALHAGQPVQVIHPAGSYSLPLIDVRELDAEQRKAEVLRLSKDESRHPCDLEKGPLLRASLVRLDEEEHVLLMTLHHIITDGWSNELLIHELTTLYQAFVADKPSPLAPLAIQYADYALWQRQWLQGRVLEAQLDYWTRQLGGVPAIKLPTDYPRPAVSGARGAMHAFALSGELSQALIALSRREGMTLFMTLLAAFQVLFYRYTEQTDLVIGTDSANRTHMETEGIIGFFVNLLALRVDLSGNPSFREVLKRVRSVVLEAYTHSDTPFELLVEKLAPDHQLGSLPLVQVLFAMQNMPDSGKEVPGNLAKMASKGSDQSSHDLGQERETVVKFDLALFIQEHAGKLFGTLNYRLDLFQTSTIATMVARFVTLLQSCVSQPDVPIGVLKFISEEEHRQHEREEERRRSRLRTRNDAWLDLPAIH